MSTDNYSIDPWNESNKLITENDIYTIFEKGGFNNARKVITINDLSIYQNAFVHSSYVKNKIIEKQTQDTKRVTLIDKPKYAIDLFDDDYESLEFLGDRCLELSISFYIYRRFPHADAGFKTVLKSMIVKKNTLAQFAEYLGLDKHIIISKQVEKFTKQGRKNKRFLEDIMEAFICAIFLDQNKTEYYSDVLHKMRELSTDNNGPRIIGPGWVIANAFIENLLEKIVDWEKLLNTEDNYIGLLLNFYQTEFKITPEFITISVEGPPHRRIFTEGVLDKDGNIIAKGVGEKKSEAQQQASLMALRYFGKDTKVSSSVQ